MDTQKNEHRQGVDMILARKIDHQEVIDIILSSEQVISAQLGQGAIVIQEVISAAVKFYQWLVDEGILKTEDTLEPITYGIAPEPRSVIREMLVEEMKKQTFPEDAVSG